MSAPSWEREPSECGQWWRYESPLGWEFTVDREASGEYQALFYACSAVDPLPIGPARKTRQAAHNDCKRHAKKLRASLVQFGRAKLP